MHRKLVLLQWFRLPRASDISVGRQIEADTAFNTVLVSCAYKSMGVV